VTASLVLENSSFRRLWIAQGISVFGDYLAMFAVQAAIVFRMHGSARAVSATLLASLLPGVVMGPMAGVFADRWSPRWANPQWTMVASDSLRAVLALLLAAAFRLSHICAICVAISTISAFFVPAQAVVIPRLVKRESLFAASAVMQQTLQVARIASPAIAGALVARFGETACYVADAGSFVFSAIILATISSESMQASAENAAVERPRDSRNVFGELREGIRFVFGTPALSYALLSMAGGTFAAGCYSALAAIYVRDVLHAGTPMYGAMGSLTAIGTLAGAVLINHKAVGRITQMGDRETLIAAGMGMIGACILLLAVSPAIFTAMMAALGIGLGAAVAMVAAEFRGRVSSVSLSLMSGAQACAIFFAGSSVGLFRDQGVGLRGVYALSGTMLLAQPAYRYFRRGTSRSRPAACFQIPR
jgi:DHA3 family macrolide efflux protein-like MFS transporter